MTTYKNLIAWKKGVEITKEVYALSSELLMTEKYNLVSQMNRAAISIPSNIAEGPGRESSMSYLSVFENSKRLFIRIGNTTYNN